MSTPLRVPFLLSIALGIWLHALPASGQTILPTPSARDFLDILPLYQARKFDFKIPPQPARPVLDNVGFLGPERNARLHEALSRAAQSDDVHVYLHIVKSLPKDGLEPITEQIAAAWLKGRFGAVVIFDDSTGKVAIKTSKLFEQRFYEYELTVVLKERQTASKRPRLSREGLEHSTMNLLAAVTQLKHRANQEDRHAEQTGLRLAVLGMFGLLLAMMEYVRMGFDQSFPGDLEEAAPSLP